jgi:exosortase
MTLPSPIIPVGSERPSPVVPEPQVGSVGVRAESAQPSAAAIAADGTGGNGAATDQPVSSQPAAAEIPEDEGLIAGFIRRLSAFANDLRSPDEALPWIAIASLSAMLIYSYWPGLMNARSSWDNPQYQHGWIVPVFSLILLVWRREPIGPVSLSARLTGFGVLAVTLLVRLFCAKYRIVTFDMYTFVPALLGVFLVAGGWSVFRWAAAPLALLIFMYPLPDEAQRYITGPLQTFNTMVATFVLQTLGFDAFRDGNLIRLGQEHVMNVVDACAGLKMLTIFVWLAAVVIVVGGLQWWENLVIALSAIPIAIMANAMRITTAGMLYGVSAEVAEGFHDSTPAALLMMGLAVGFIMLEIKLLSYVIVSDEYTPAFVPAAATAAGPGAGGARRPAQPAGFPMIPGFGPPGGRAETGEKAG